MFIKGKNGSTLQGGTVFQNGSRVEPFWLHFFSQCSIAGTPWFWFQFRFFGKIPIPIFWKNPKSDFDSSEKSADSILIPMPAPNPWFWCDQMCNSWFWFHDQNLWFRFWVLFHQGFQPLEKSWKPGCDQMHVQFLIPDSDSNSIIKLSASDSGSDFGIGIEHHWLEYAHLTCPILVKQNDRLTVNFHFYFFSPPHSPAKSTLAYGSKLMFASVYCMSIEV